ncbi:MAG: PilZ domain-containing protein [Planctomycetes bacterium]|nr:PilZ domain-containing protein [Planctomycetota bacterium]
MSGSSAKDRRKFVRVNTDLKVRFKFIWLAPGKPHDLEMFEGCTRNLSRDGMLLIGKLPNLDWISHLLMSKLVLGVVLEMPGGQPSVKALCRTAWLEAIDEESKRTAFGLVFSEITAEDQGRVQRFVIESQL